MKKLISILLVVCIMVGFTVPFAGAADELTTLQKAVVQTALSYYYKGNAVHYDSYYLANGTRTRSGILRQTNNREPEESSIDDIHYTVCSAFPHDTYKSVFGEHIVDLEIQQQIAHLTHVFEEQHAGGAGLSEKELDYLLGLEGITANYVAMGQLWMQSGKYHGVAGTAYANMTGAVNPGNSVVGYWGPARDANDKVLYVTADGVDVPYGEDNKFIYNPSPANAAAPEVQDANGNYVLESSLLIKERSGSFVDGSVSGMIATGDTATSISWTDFADGLQPGDIIAVFRTSGDDQTDDGGGHTMMFLGDIFGDGQDYILHSSGSKYNNNDETTLNFKDENGNVLVGYDLVEDMSSIKKSGNYSRNGSIYMNPMHTLFGDGSFYNPAKGVLKEICILRPINRMTAADLTPAAQFRLDYPAVTATKRASVKPYRDVKPTDSITYTVRLENHSTETTYKGFTPSGASTKLTNGYVATFMNPGTARVISLQETVPAGATVTAISDGGTLKGNVITWEKVTVTAGEMKELTYTVTVGGTAGGQIVSPSGKIYGSNSTGYLGTKELVHEIVAEQMPTTGMDAITSSTLSPHAYGTREDTDAAEDIYRALGYELQLPDAAELADILTDTVVQSRESGSYVGRNDLILRSPENVTDPAEKALVEMIVPGFVGGKRLHTVDENMVRTNENRLRMLDMGMLQPGDILVFANTTKSLKMAFNEANCKVYVYLGNNRFGYYKDGAFTVESAPIKTYATYYTSGDSKYVKVMSGNDNFAADAGTNVLPEVTFSSGKYTANRKYTHSTVLHQSFLQDFFVALRPSRVGLTSVGVPEASSKKVAAFELVTGDANGFVCRAMASAYNAAAAGNTVLFHEDADHSALPEGETFDLNRKVGAIIDLNGFSYSGDVTVAGETVKNGTFYGNVTVGNGAVLENVDIDGVLTISGNATLKNVNVVADVAPVVYTSGSATIQELKVLTADSLNWVPAAQLGTCEKMTGVRSRDGQSDPSVTGAYRGYAINCAPVCRVETSSGTTEYASFSDGWNTGTKTGATVTLLKDIDTADYTEWCQRNYGTDSKTTNTYQKANYFFANLPYGQSTTYKAMTLDFNGFNMTDNLSTNGTFFFRTKLVTLKNSAQEPSYFRAGVTAINSGTQMVVENLNIISGQSCIFMSSSGVASQKATVIGGSLVAGLNGNAINAHALYLLLGTGSVEGGTLLASKSNQPIHQAAGSTLTLKDATFAAPLYVYNRYGLYSGVRDIQQPENYIQTAAGMPVALTFGDQVAVGYADVYATDVKVKIGDKEYTSVEEAFADAKEGDKLAMQESLTVETSVDVPAGVELALEETTLTLAEGATLTVAGTVTAGENGKIAAEKSQIVLTESGDYMGITYPTGEERTAHPDLELNDAEVSVEAAGTLKLNITAEGLDYANLELYDVNLCAGVARIMANQMSEVFTVIPMARVGEELYVGAKREISVKSEAEAKLATTDWADETDAKEGRALVALLNYGMEAQKLLNGENVENNYMNTYKTQMSALTDQLAATKQDNSLLSAKDMTVIYGATGVMEDNLKLRFYFREEVGKYEDLKVNVTYGDTDVTLNVADLEAAGGTETVKFYRYTVEDINQADYAETITVKVLAGEEVLATAKDTIASYAARLYAANGGQRAAMADAMLLYGMAAKAFGK